MLQCLKQLGIGGLVYAEGFPNSALGVANILRWSRVRSSIPYFAASCIINNPNACSVSLYCFGHALLNTDRFKFTPLAVR